MLARLKISLQINFTLLLMSKLIRETLETLRGSGSLWGKSKNINLIVTHIDYKNINSISLSTDLPDLQNVSNIF